MKIQKLVIIFSCFFFSNSLFASIGVVDGRAIEYGLSPHGFFLILMIASIVLFIEVLMIVALAFMKKKSMIFKILKINMVVIPVIILLIITIPQVKKAFSEDCIVNSQEELEQLDLHNLTKINGHLLLAGVNDLTPLQNITEISGDLIIGYEEWDIHKENQDLRSLNGLNELKTIGGKLIIRDTSISSLKGLENLTTVKNGVEIKYNKKLLDYCSITNYNLKKKLNISNNLFNPSAEELLSKTNCKNTSSKKTETLENEKLISFLEHPIDLLTFKKKKETLFTSTVINGTEFYFNPEKKDSVFYSYSYPIENYVSSKEFTQIVVFKHGVNKHRYEDKSETLIEIQVFKKDLDLGRANFVGVSQTELETRFGKNHLTFDRGIVYSHKDKILILELNNSKVHSYRYIKLNREKIDNDLIRQIRR